MHQTNAGKRATDADARAGRLAPPGRKPARIADPFRSRTPVRVEGWPEVLDVPAAPPRFAAPADPDPEDLRIRPDLAAMPAGGDFGPRADRSGRWVQHVICSVRDGRQKPLRGAAEAALGVLLETNPAVRRWDVQDEPVAAFVGGVAHRRAPRFRVERADGVWVLDLWRGAMAAPVVDALRERYAEAGVRYAPVAERDALAQPRLDNAHLLLRYHGTRITPATRAAIAAALAARGGLATIDELVASHPRISPGAILSEVLQGRLRIDDLGRPAGGGAVVRLAPAPDRS
jgi:hypothetical protein